MLKVVSVSKVRIIKRCLEGRQLTPREVEFLALLRGPWSIKEIAGNLNISHGTAKSHTIKIYGKLGVNRRWDAVARAEELNLLPLR